MSGPFEQYVEQATKAVMAANYMAADEITEGLVRADVQLALATVGPLIAEDARDRMVAAAGAALEREGETAPTPAAGGWSAEDVERLHAKGRCTEKAEHHHYTDSTGIHWVHQGPAVACSAPECHEVRL